MSTPITPISSIAAFGRSAWRARSLTLPLLVAGALAAGCGTATVSQGESAAGQASASSSAAGSTSGSAAAAGSATPAAPGATPVPTVTGGPVSAGGTECSGWPADAAHGKLTSSFTPTSVERCVTSYQEIAGKGEWQTATLERSTDRLATLSEVLMAPSASRPPDVMCPEFVILPPQIVLFNAAGQELVPKFPTGACGAINSLVLSTLASMTWQPVSVRLVTQVQGVPKTFPGASIGPGSPKMIQTGVANGTPVH